MSDFNSTEHQATENQGTENQGAENHSAQKDRGQNDMGQNDMGQNVDASEVDKFSQMASKWWDKHSEFKPLHDINPLRMGYITERVKVKDLELLDVGCGGGILSEALALEGAKVTGIDAGELPLKVAKLHALETDISIDYQQTTIEEFALKAGKKKFDVITCLEMLEHVPDPDSVIKSCGDLLKPGGHLFLSTINRNLKSYMFMVIGAEYVLKMLPKGTHDYDKLIKPSELSRSLRKHGFRVGDISGMTYNPITQKYRISTDTDVNYLLHAVRLA